MVHHTHHLLVSESDDTELKQFRTSILTRRNFSLDKLYKIKVQVKKSYETYQNNNHGGCHGSDVLDCGQSICPNGALNLVLRPAACRWRGASGALYQ
jgi:hypothetical protein